MTKFELNKTYLRIKKGGYGYDEDATITIYKVVNRTEKFLTVEVRTLSVMYTGADYYRNISLDDKVQNVLKDTNMLSNTPAHKTRGKINISYNNEYEFIEVYTNSYSVCKSLLSANDKIID